MNLSLFIAKRYFFSKKKSFINFLSITAFIGVMVGTSSLIIVLSVFNGLEDFTVTVSDGDLTDTQVLSVIVNPVNDAPIAEDTSAQTENINNRKQVLIKENEPLPAVKAKLRSIASSRENFFRDNN